MLYTSATRITDIVSSVLYTQVPVVDLSASDEEAAAVLAYGCQVFGFFYSKNHAKSQLAAQMR